MPADIVGDAVVGAELQVAGQDQAQKEEAAVRAGGNSLEKHPPGGVGAEDYPSEEELHTLRRVSDHIPIKLFTIAFIELCERFSYYGTVIVVRIRPAPRSMDYRMTDFCLSVSDLQLMPIWPAGERMDMETIADKTRHELHSAASPSRLYHRCRRPGWPVRRPGHGTACFHGDHDV